MLGFRRIAGAGRAWRVFHHHPRYFADRGLNRKDYTDPGFQKSGYINPSWFAHTQEGKFKGRHPPRDPVYCGSVEDDDHFRRKLKKRKLGEARKQFERARSKLEAERQRDLMKTPSVSFEDEIVPELELVKEARKLSETLKSRHKRVNGKRAVVFKGRVLREDYDNFEYRGSGLDTYTNRVLEKRGMKKHEETDPEEDE